MSEHWLEKVWALNNLNLYGYNEKFQRLINPVPEYFRDERSNDKNAPMTSHLRSEEEFITQVFCWLLNSSKCTAFKKKFLSEISRDISTNLRFQAEVENGEERYDMIAGENNDDFKKPYFMIVENKIAADFPPNQLKNYANQLREKGYLIVITRYKFEEEKEKKSFEIPNGITLKHFYWKDIYKILDELPCKIREEVCECFHSFELDGAILDRLDANDRKLNRDKFYYFIGDIAEEIRTQHPQYKLKKNPAGGQGFFSYDIYPTIFERSTGKSTNFYPAIPSFHIEVNGTLIRNFSKWSDSKYHEPISIVVKTFSLITVGSGITNKVSQRICKLLYKGSNKKCCWQEFTYPDNTRRIQRFPALEVYVEAKFDTSSSDIDLKGQCGRELKEFLFNAFDDWHNTFSSLVIHNQSSL